MATPPANLSQGNKEVARKKRSVLRGLIPVLRPAASIRATLAAVGKGIKEDQVHITMKLKDGRVLEKYVEHCLGSVDTPMSDADLEIKFRGLSEEVLGAAQTRELIALCWSVASLPDAGAIARTAARNAT